MPFNRKNNSIIGMVILLLISVSSLLIWGTRKNDFSKLAEEKWMAGNLEQATSYAQEKLNEDPLNLRAWEIIYLSQQELNPKASLEALLRLSELTEKVEHDLAALELSLQTASWAKARSIAVKLSQRTDLPIKAYDLLIEEAIIRKVPMEVDQRLQRKISKVQKQATANFPKLTKTIISLKDDDPLNDFSSVQELESLLEDAHNDKSVLENILYQLITTNSDALIFEWSTKNINHADSKLSDWLLHAEVVHHFAHHAIDQFLNKLYQSPPSTKILFAVSLFYFDNGHRHHLNNYLPQYSLNPADPYYGELLELKLSWHALEKDWYAIGQILKEEQVATNEFTYLFWNTLAARYINPQKEPIYRRILKEAFSETVFDPLKKNTRFSLLAQTDWTSATESIAETLIEFSLPASFAAMMWLESQAIENQDIEQHLALLDKKIIQQIATKTDINLYARGLLLLKREIPKATRLINSLIEQDPNNPEYLATKCLALCLNQKPAEAISLFHQTHQPKSQQFNLFYYIARAIEGETFSKEDLQENIDATQLWPHEFSYYHRLLHQDKISIPHH